MNAFIVLIYFELILSLGQMSSVDDMELVMAFLVHRHGDRTPIASSVAFSTDVEAVEAKTAKYGYGQLTNAGKRRAYHLGEFIRNRYNKLLSPYYNSSEIYIRSTDSTRAKITVLSAMAAVYPATKDNWSQDINWTPVPYTTVPAKYDPNSASINCPSFVTLEYKRMFSTSEEMDVYSELLDQWSEISGYNVSSMIYMPISLYDVYMSQISLGVPVSNEITQLLPEIEKAVATAWDIVHGNKNSVAFEAGVLVNQFFTVADQIVAGEDVPRVQVLSAHDTNVFSFKAATGISPIPVVGYAAMYALELRKTSDGQYLIVPVFLPDPNEGTFNYLQMEGCDGFCDLESFRNMTSTYALDEDTWRSECGWTEDYSIDTSGID